MEATQPPKGVYVIDIKRASPFTPSGCVGIRGIRGKKIINSLQQKSRKHHFFYKIA